MNDREKINASLDASLDAYINEHIVSMNLKSDIWNWDVLSEHPGLSPDFILNNCTVEKIGYISKNPNLTYEFIKNHMDIINFKLLSNNLFNFNVIRAENLDTRPKLISVVKSTLNKHIIPNLRNIICEYL